MSVSEMSEHALTLGSLVLVLVLAVVGMVMGGGGGGGGEALVSHAVAGNDVEFNRARSLHPERNFDEGNEELEDEDEDGELDLGIQDFMHDETDIHDEEEENEEEEGDEGGEEGMEDEEHDTNLMNLIETRPEVVAMNPFAVDTKVDDQQVEKKRRRRPHDSRKARRERRRRRRWKKKMKAAKKFYRGNRTFKWGSEKHQKSSGASPSSQRQWSPPDRREYTDLSPLVHVIILCAEYSLKLKELFLINNYRKSTRK